MAQGTTGNLLIMPHTSQESKIRITGFVVNVAGFYLERNLYFAQIANPITLVIVDNASALKV